MHSALHGSTHYIAAVSEDFHGAGLAKADHPIGRAARYDNLATAPPVPPPLS
jgi:hypothetical protein